MTAAPGVAGPEAEPATRTAGRSAARARRALASSVALAGRHRLFTVLLLAGLALRVVTALTYRPALLYYDSVPYLQSADAMVPGGVRPMGYSLFLRALPLEHQLAVVPVTQHLMALGLAVLIYALLLRLGVRRWIAAVAAAPLLLDAYQLYLEQYVLAETLFEVLLVGALALILWRRPLHVPPAALAGLLLAFAAVTRANGLILFAPVLVGVLFLRPRVAVVAALVAAFAVPVGAYMAWYHHHHGTYAISGYGGRFLYARVAGFADCGKVPLPPRDRILCPKEPLGKRLPVEWYMWSPRYSPIYKITGGLPPGARSNDHLVRLRNQIAGDFAKRVILHQPVPYAKRVVKGFLRGFSLTRTRKYGELPIERWRFQLTYPIYRPQTDAIVRADGGGKPEVSRSLARIMRTYQLDGGYAPGPLLGLCVLVALLAVLGVGAARRSGLRVAAFLFASVGVLALLSTVAVNQFTWRYFVPEVALLPAAGAIGLAALVRRAREPGGPAAPEGAAGGDAILAGFR